MMGMGYETIRKIKYLTWEESKGGGRLRQTSLRTMYSLIINI